MSWDLVADIGGTNMRVAQVIDGKIAERRKFSMVPGLDVAQTLRSVAEELGGAPGAVICAGAGPVRDGQINLTNGGWLVCERQIGKATNARQVRVINDFEAAAWSLATLDDEDVVPIGETGPLTTGHRVAVGPGTGLGVGSLIWAGGRYHVVPGEGGHVAIGPNTSDEVPVFERMAELWPETRLGRTITFEAEAMLSGTGLPYLYQACGGAAETDAAQIFAKANQGDDAAAKCIALFRSHLAGVAGDLAVTLKARGGIFLVGGVAQANADVFGAEFWDDYYAGGRFSDLRRECGIYLVAIEDFGLRGCVNVLTMDM